VVGSRPSSNCDACFATFHLLSYCNSLGNCRAALLVTLAEQRATALLLAHWLLHQLSCCLPPRCSHPWLLCQEASYRDIRHDERPRLHRGHSSCRMSPLAMSLPPCAGATTCIHFYWAANWRRGRSLASYTPAWLPGCLAEAGSIATGTDKIVFQLMSESQSKKFV
jgi:hypothetical protein